MYTVAINGAGGFIGRNLAKYFLEKGHRVYGIDINEKGMTELSDYQHFISVCTNDKKIEDIIKEKIDIYYHLAWGGSLLSKDLQNLDLQLNNIKMSIDYLEQMIKIGVKKVIFCGSSYQYMVDNDTGLKTSYYGLAKNMTLNLYADYCRKNNIEFNGVLLTNTYGYGDYSTKAVNTLIGKMEAGESLSLVEGKYQNDWVYIDDTVRGLYLVFESGVNFESYYIGNIEISTFKEKIISMKNILHYNKNLVFGEYPENTHVDYSFLDANKTLIDTGFSCEVTFEEGIKKTAEWLKVKEKVQ